MVIGEKVIEIMEFADKSFNTSINNTFKDLKESINIMRKEVEYIYKD